MKCDAYRTRIREENNAFSSTWIMHSEIGYCNATRKRDECSCGGDRSKCTFYPEVRKRESSENVTKVHNGGELILTKQEVERLEQLANELLDVLKSKRNR